MESLPGATAYDAWLQGQKDDLAQQRKLAEGMPDGPEQVARLKSIANALLKLSATCAKRWHKVIKELQKKCRVMKKESYHKMQNDESLSARCINLSKLPFNVRHPGRI